MAVKAFITDSNSAKWTAEEMSGLMSKIANEGVLDSTGSDTDFKVTETTVPAMTVDIAVGFAVVEYLKNARTWLVCTENNAVATVAVTSNSSGSDRVDAVVIHLKQTEANTLKTNVAELLVIPGSGVSALADAAIDAYIGDTNWYRLADITIPSGDTAITNSQIADTRAIVTLKVLPENGADAYVTLDTNQTGITGDKTWEGDHIFNGSTIFADDGAETETTAAPTSAKKLTNKEYVDNQVAITQSQAQTLTFGEDIDGSTTPQLVTYLGDSDYKKNIYIHANGNNDTYPFQHITYTPSSFSDLNFADVDTSTRRAQSFSTGDDGAVSWNLKRALFWMSKTGTPSSNTVLEAMSNSSSKPGSVLTNGSSANISQSGITDNNNQIFEATWSTAPEMDPNTQYWIAFKSDGVNNGSNYPRLGYFSSNKYSGKGVCDYTASSTSWSSVDTAKNIALYLEFEVDYGNRVYKYNPNDMAKGSLYGCTASDSLEDETGLVLPAGRVIDGFPASTFDEVGPVFPDGSTAGALVQDQPSATFDKVMGMVGKAYQDDAFLLWDYPKRMVTWMSSIQLMEAAVAGSAKFFIPCGFHPAKVKISYTGYDASASGTGPGVLRMHTFYDNLGLNDFIIDTLGTTYKTLNSTTQVFGGGYIPVTTPILDSSNWKPNFLPGNFYKNGIDMTLYLAGSDIVNFILIEIEGY